MLDQPPVLLTTKDLRTILNDFLKEGGYLDVRYGNRRANFRETGVGMAELELLAGIGEVFHFGVNKEAAETNLFTAREPDNVILRARERAYEPRMPTAASGTVTFTPAASAPSGAYIIRAGHVFRTDPEYGASVKMEAMETKIQNQGQPVDILVAEGESIVDPDRRSIGLVGRRVPLLQYPVIQDSVTHLVDGVTWTQVDSFLESGPSSKHYRVIQREVYPGTRITFLEYGNGTNGLYPPRGSLLQTSYRIGGGVSGNVPAGWVTVSESPVLTVFGAASVEGTVTNAADLTGGSDQESVDDIRLNAIGPMVTNSRVVSNTDYALAARMKGAARAKAVTNNEWSLIDENTVVVYCSNVLGTLMTTTACNVLRDAVLLDYPKCGTTRVVFSPAHFDEFTVTVAVVLASGADYDTVSDDVQRITAAFFSYAAVLANPNPRYVIDVGQKVYPDQLGDLLHEIEGVVSVDIDFDGVHEPFEPDPYKVPYASTVSYSYSFES